MSFGGCQTGRSLGRLVVCLLLGLLLGSRPALAQTSVSATVGLDGYARAGQPMPVQITLDHSGPPATAGVVVRADRRGPSMDGEEHLPTYRLGPLRLPAGGHWHGSVYLQASSTGRQAQVVMDVNGRIAQELQPAINGVAADDTLLVTTGGRAVALKALSGLALRP